MVNDRLRIADADREQAARELGEHFALGRITVEEHAERLEQIWAARTAVDLAPPFRDLPRPAARPRAAGAARGAATTAVRERGGWRPAMPHVPFLFKALLAIVVLWWGVHHALFLLVAAIVYVAIVRRLVHRGRSPGRGRGRPRPWDQNRYHAGWH